MLSYKNLISCAVIVLLLATISLTVAFWDNLTAKDDSKIEVGVGTVVTVNEVLAGSEKKLIPLGAILGKNDTWEITKEFDVILSKSLSEAMYLDVKVDEIFIGEEEYDGLINVEIVSNPKIISEEKVKLIFTMNNFDFDYSKVQNQKIRYSVHFSVTNDNPM
ncbi:MAG TPA: hypothetical protein GX740_01045 [Acholeplasmataceae bacterium]|nr:hypothetical protein [Acholeplasmataceae bacterium]